MGLWCKAPAWPAALRSVEERERWLPSFLTPSRPGQGLCTHPDLLPEYSSPLLTQVMPQVKMLQTHRKLP